MSQSITDRKVTMDSVWSQNSKENAKARMVNGIKAIYIYIYYRKDEG